MICNLDADLCFEKDRSRFSVQGSRFKHALSDKRFFMRRQVRPERMMDSSENSPCRIGEPANIPQKSASDDNWRMEPRKGR
jgi:hypothetical protein